MSVSQRWLGGVALSALVVLGLLSRPAPAQQSAGAPAATRPAAPPPDTAINPNFYVNPYATRGQVPNAGVLGQNLRNAPVTTGASYATPAPAAAAPSTGYGSLAPSYASSASAGYGSLSNNNANNNSNSGYDPYYGGYGWGTQWMMNPYQGYLRGAASLTTANAEYQLTIQQAKLTRQEAIRSAIQTRRAWIEQAEYERAHMPDPEKIRQEQLRRELDHARVSPPLTEVWSGRSLNALLRHLIAQQGQGVRGPNVPLNEDTLKSINLTPGDSRANAGLLKDRAALQWPQPLQAEIFKEPREDLNRRLKDAVNTVRSGNATPDPATINDLEADLKRLQETLEANVSALSLDQYIEANRYLRQVGSAVTALKDRNVSNYLNGSWSAKARSVAELVKYMADKGLWFAPATPGEEPAYLSLYHSLAAFDAGITRLAGSGGGEGAQK
jgi:hypothetical protein